MGGIVPLPEEEIGGGEGLPGREEAVEWVRRHHKDCDRIR
jgi:hypothetical protein